MEHGGCLFGALASSHWAWGCRRTPELQVLAVGATWGDALLPTCAAPSRAPNATLWQPGANLHKETWSRPGWRIPR